MGFFVVVVGLFVCFVLFVRGKCPSAIIRPNLEKFPNNLANDESTDSIRALLARKK